MMREAVQYSGINTVFVKGLSVRPRHRRIQCLLPQDAPGRVRRVPRVQPAVQLRQLRQPPHLLGVQVCPAGYDEQQGPSSAEVQSAMYLGQPPVQSLAAYRVAAAMAAKPRLKLPKGKLPVAP